MTLRDVLKYFGNWQNAAMQIGVSRSTVAKWVQRKSIPFCAQLKIEKATGGNMLALERDDLNIRGERGKYVTTR